MGEGLVGEGGDSGWGSSVRIHVATFRSYLLTNAHLVGVGLGSATLRPFDNHFWLAWMVRVGYYK